MVESDPKGDAARQLRGGAVRDAQEAPRDGGLRRSLKNRHIQLIALGGAIGTGLFYGSSESISLAGPAILVGAILGVVAAMLVSQVRRQRRAEDAALEEKIAKAAGKGDDAR